MYCFYLALLIDSDKSSLQQLSTSAEGESIDHQPLQVETSPVAFRDDLRGGCYVWVLASDDTLTSQGWA